jgi:excisionase family DNA binding protein
MVTNVSRTRRLAMQEEKMFWTVNEVATYLNVKPSTVYSWLKAWQIPHYRIGKMVRFRKPDVDIWMERHRREGDSVKQKVRGVLREISKPPLDINHLVKKSIDEVKGNGYTSHYGKPDRIKGLGREVSDGTL